MMSVVVSKPSINDCSEIVNIANRVYFETEKEFWKEGYYRISTLECQNYINEGKVIAAKLDNQIIGFVLAGPKSELTFEFSMLTTDFKYQKKGVGKLLINEIFKSAKNQGFKYLEIEVLTPKHWTHSQKEFLAEWYSSLGFSFVNSFTFKEKYPTHIKFMKCELEFKLYQKKL
jgi:dTDP-4-amino-4,6-dideoxy-D-galactose acyltransferase